MAEIRKYVVTEDPDEWGDEHQYDSAQEARIEAQRRQAALIELVYVFDDSSLVEDYRDVKESERNQ